MCDELFFTGTAVAIAPVVRVDHRPVGNGAIGPIARRLQQLYVDATRGHNQVYRNWLTPVYQAQATDRTGSPLYTPNCMPCKTQVLPLKHASGPAQPRRNDDANCNHDRKRL